MQRTLTAQGRADFTRIEKDLVARLGPLDRTRWSYGFEYKEGEGSTVTVYLFDDGIDANGVQALLDFHVSEAGVEARRREQEAWELATQPACPRCGARRWQHGYDEDGGRARDFAIFAAILLAIAAGMHLASVPWSLVPAGLALFVLFQGALKWLSYATRTCKACRHSVIDWTGRPPDRMP